MVARVKKGDQVVVTAGKDKGKRGAILAVYPRRERVLVSGVHVVKKHVKGREDKKSEIVQKELSVHWSNVSHVDPKDKKPTRVGIRVEDGKKVRYAQRTGEVIDR